MVGAKRSSQQSETIIKWKILACQSLISLPVLPDPCGRCDKSGFRAGFSAAGDTFDLIVVLFQILFDMDFLQHRFVDDFLVPDRKIQEDRKAPVCLILVFAGAADVDILISVAPVIDLHLKLTRD